MAVVTPFQTVGPFFDFGLELETGEVVATAAAQRAARLSSRAPLRDGAGDPVQDAIVEVWQANAAGEYRHPADDRDVPLDPACDGFGRVATTIDGRFTFSTVMPDASPDRTAGCRRRTCSSASWRGAFSRASSPGCTSRTSRRTPTIRFWQLVPAESARRRSCSPDRRRTGTRSTSCCRGRARPCSSTCRGKGGADLMTEVERRFAEDRACRRCSTSRLALAEAEAQRRDHPGTRRRRSRSAARADRFDLAAMRRPTRSRPAISPSHWSRRLTGSSRTAIPTPRRLRALGRNQPGHHRHRARAAAARGVCRSSCATRSRRHPPPRRTRVAMRRTPMAGRTWLQQATPITFGLKAAGWLDALAARSTAIGVQRRRALVPAVRRRLRHARGARRRRPERCRRGLARALDSAGARDALARASRSAGDARVRAGRLVRHAGQDRPRPRAARADRGRRGASKPRAERRRLVVDAAQAESGPRRRARSRRRCARRGSSRRC